MSDALQLCRKWIEEDEGRTLEAIVSIDETSRMRTGRPGFNEQWVAMCKAIIAAQATPPEARLIEEVIAAAREIPGIKIKAGVVLYPSRLVDALAALDATRSPQRRVEE